MRRFHRSERISEELVREISSIIHNDMKDPRVGKLVSLTKVEVSRDLRHATVSVSVYGPTEERRRTMDALRSGAGFVRSLIGRRMRIRSAPEITFRLDDSIEYSARIGEILKEVAPPPDDTEPVEDDDRPADEADD